MIRKQKCLSRNMGHRGQEEASIQVLLRAVYLVGSREQGCLPGACFPAHSGHQLETWSASQQGQGAAGRTGPGQRRSAERCLQSHKVFAVGA